MSENNPQKALILPATSTGTRVRATGTGTATALSQTAQNYGQKISEAATQAKDYVSGQGLRRRR